MVDLPEMVDPSGMVLHFLLLPGGRFRFAEGLD